MVLSNYFAVLLFIASARATKLKLHENYAVEWEVNKDIITFEVSVATKGWIGFGISPNGAMASSDIVVAAVKANGTVFFEDRHGIGNREPVKDTQQDYKLITAFENDTQTVIKFSRKLETCDENDVTISNDTLRIIWSYGTTDELSYHGQNRSSKSVNFLDPEVKEPNSSEYKTWRVSKRLKIPSNDTTYWCAFHRGPHLTKKHHIVGFNVYLDGPQAERHVHHADFLKCTPPAGENAEEYFGRHLGSGYDCYFPKTTFPLEACQQFELQWAIGAQATMFPDYVGIPIEASTNDFYMTEIHFDNPDKLSNLDFEAGLDIYYTDSLRKYDAGFIQLGTLSTKTFAITIPPNSTDFVVSSHCPGQCTSPIPSDGVNVFNVLLHSHMSGRKIKLRHYREGEELPWFANDNSFDFSYQNNRPLRDEKKLLKNDALTLECTYNNEWSKGFVTLGGRSSRDEMCQSMLLYYPRVDNLNLCGDYFPQPNMLKYMGIENVTIEFGKSDPIISAPQSLKGKKYSEVVEEIDWTPEKRKEFQMLTRYGNHISVCDAEPNKTDTQVSYPKVSKEYQPPENCLQVPSRNSGSVVSNVGIMAFISITIFLFLVDKCRL